MIAKSSRRFFKWLEVDWHDGDCVTSFAKAGFSTAKDVAGLIRTGPAIARGDCEGGPVFKQR